jgi:hypothetical protein
MTPSSSSTSAARPELRRRAAADAQLDGALGSPLGAAKASGELPEDADADFLFVNLANLFFWRAGGAARDKSGSDLARFGRHNSRNYSAPWARGVMIEAVGFLWMIASH